MSCLLIAMTFIVGGTTAAFYGWMPLYLPELFPTRVRATGQGVGYQLRPDRRRRGGAGAGVAGWPFRQASTPTRPPSSRWYTRWDGADLACPGDTRQAASGLNLAAGQQHCIVRNDPRPSKELQHRPWQDLFE